MVLFKRTTQAKLNTIPLVDGQMIAVYDESTGINKVYIDFIDNTTQSIVRRLYGSSNSGGGHIIMNQNGTSVTGRTSLQFNNATITDDSANDKTIVTIPEGLQLGTTSTTALKGDTKYAGSSSAGGAATSADKLNTNAGNTTTPVYFADGIPKALGYTLAKSVPSDAKFTDTDTKVTQTASTTNANYRVLMSATADDTTRTEASVKSSKIYGNPNTGNLQVTQLNGVTVGTSPKFTDTTYSAVTSSANGLAISTDKAKFDAMAFISYGTCTTAAGTQAKVATLTNSNWSLKVGSLVGIKFTNNNTFNATASAQITLNVNNTGAKPIYGYGSATANTGTNTTLYGRANYINYYMYDGTYWVWAGSSGDNNTTYTPQSLGFGYGTCSTAASTAAKVVTLSGYNLVVNGMVSVKFTNSVPANATLNINSKGAKAIYYRGVSIPAGIIAAGDTATFVYVNNVYHLISLDWIWSATVHVTTTSSELYNKTVVASKSGVVKASSVLSSTGETTMVLHEPGTYTFSCTI